MYDCCVLLWCLPEDVQVEHKALTTVIEELNGGICWQRKLWMVSARWKTDSSSDCRLEGPQGLIESIPHIEQCDLLIGIFWKCLGVPTDRSQSLIEHAFLRANTACQQQGSPQIIVCFNQRPYTPRTVDEAEQWKQVLAFRDQLPDDMRCLYRGKEDVERRIRSHLSQFLQRRNTEGTPH